MKVVNGEQIFTHDSDGDRGGQTCQCVVCGLTRKCVPWFDYYTVDERNDDALVCEDCFNRIVAKELQGNSK